MVMLAFGGVVQDVVAMISMELSPKVCFFLLCSETRGRTKKKHLLGQIMSSEPRKKPGLTFLESWLFNSDPYGGLP